MHSYEACQVKHNDILATGSELMGTILITSRLGEDFRDDLEQVMFFNPKQNYAENAIRDCVQHYGAPEIITENGYLRIWFESFSIAQTLFLIDHSESEDILAGMIVYVREGWDDILILHVAIAEKYILKGPVITARLVWDLLRHVIESASHISGIKNIKLVYGNYLGKGKGRPISIPVIRNADKKKQAEHKSDTCPDKSITCYEYQRCFDCPQKFISKTRDRTTDEAISSDSFATST
jgi:hypothetical protein